MISPFQELNLMIYFFYFYLIIVVYKKSSGIELMFNFAKNKI